MRSSLLRTVLALVVVLGTWELACRLGHVQPTTLPAPSDAWTAGWTARTCWPPRSASPRPEALAGLSAALVVGGLVGLLTAISRPVRGVLEPILVISQTIPVIALAPCS